MNAFTFFDVQWSILRESQIHRDFLMAYIFLNCIEITSIACSKNSLGPLNRQNRNRGAR